MNWKLFILLLGAIWTFSLQGCYYDVESNLYVGLECDTTLVGFVARIEPIISSNCVVCHGGASPDGNLSLETYEQIRDAALSGAISDRVERNVGSPLLMPPNGPLAVCDLRALEDWTRDGAPEN